MIERHIACKVPEDPNEKIWRYMSFAKFVNLLTTRSLFFSRVDKLGDQFEMTRPRKNYEEERKFYSTVVEPKYPDWPFERFLKLLTKIREGVLINCWHKNNYESAAMWSQYLKTNEGIAIQTTIGKLTNELEKVPDEILISDVRYIDYDLDNIEGNTIVGLVTHKLSIYTHEAEFRAIILDQFISELVPKYEFGKNIFIDPNNIIECVYLAPNSPEWFKETVNSIVKSFRLNSTIVSSGLNDRSLI